MKKKKNKPTTRAEPNQRSSFAFVSADSWDTLECFGYTSLAHNPEIIAAVDTIARLVGSMTIQLQENTASGDIRIKDELSRKIDITPNQYMTRFNFMYWLVKTILLEGNGNAVVYPETNQGILKNLVPIPPSMVSFVADGWGYKILINGKQYAPDALLHFAVNPHSQYPWKGEGNKIALKEVANNLKQASKTQKGFMESKWKPSMIIKIDGMIDEFAQREGREKLLEEYISTANAGTPWMIPAGIMEVEQVKPLTLADLAIADVVTLDKKTVASIVGVPAFVLGVGDFDRNEWNNFINAKIMPIARMIEQEFTKKLLISPKRFFKFSARSLYNYDLREMATVADEQYVKGLMSGNEVRDWLGLPPLEGLDELVMLENYIPAGMIGEQKKLIQKEGG